MFQFGYELRGSSSAGLLAVDGLAQPLQAIMLAKDAIKYTDVLTIYTNDNSELATQLATQLAASPTIGAMSVDDRKILRFSEGTRASRSPRVIITFANGTETMEDFIHHRPLTRVANRFIDQLGLVVTPTGDIEAPLPFCRTNVSGVFAAGDCASVMKIIPNAIATGAYAGCGMSRELVKK
ncbi:hypothetical protein RRF57_012503 [Xylaria bambusicola]|uniref:FAD/NAD(P)-binding domain-containing protein n=1 Tax=Xylaria bambusicola TaxID=326684 RepID=A0AAN7V0M7_9PEZI